MLMTAHNKLTLISTTIAIMEIRPMMITSRKVLYRGRNFILT